MQEKEAFDIVWNACEGLSRKAFTKLTKELCKVIAPGVEFVRIEEKRAIFRSKAVDLLTVESVFSKVFKVTISGIEGRLKKEGAKNGIKGVYPHRFRRTFATWALSAGVPVDQIRILLGHENIQTTLRYALTEQEQVSNSYRSIIEKSL